MKSDLCPQLSEILLRNNFTLAQIERMVVVSALKRYRRNRAAVCRVLKISRSSLYRKVEKYGIELDPYTPGVEPPPQPTVEQTPPLHYAEVRSNLTNYGPGDS